MTGVTHYTVAAIDACSNPDPHESHLRQPMWPRQDGKPHDPAWLWCIGSYDQYRQTRRVVIADTDGEQALVGEGLTLVGSALREKREPGACGECCEPEDFDWDPINWVPEGAVIVCHVHQMLAPGWIYEVEVGPFAWRNDAHVIA